MNKLLVLAAGLAFAGFASATTQQPGLGTPSVVVNYGDLNLDSRNGVATLHARLRSAAQEVCSPLHSRLPGVREKFDSCVASAVSRSVRDVGKSRLTRFHRYGAKRTVVEIATVRS